MSTPSSGTRLIEAPTFVEAFRKVVDAHGDVVALRTLDDSVSLTYAKLRDRAHAVARGLAKLGLGRGEPLAMMLSNRPEFHVTDLAAMSVGAVPFSIYQTLSPEQIAYVVSDAGARIAVVEHAYLRSFLEAKPSIPNLEHLVVLDGTVPAGAVAFADVEATGGSFDVETEASKVAPEDLLTLIYTSGTTGPPKGVQLTHRNLMSIIAGINAMVELPPRGRIVSWLPTAHIAERALNYYLPMLVGSTITTCPNPREIVQVLPKVKPHFFFAVPRIWEKLKAGLETRLGSLPEEQRAGVQKALAAAVEKVRLEQRDEPVPSALAAAVAKADQEMFSMIRAMVGLDEARVLGTGAAPCPPEVLEFLHAIGLRVGEGWGMSETTGIGTMNPPDRIRIGTVGKAVPGIELRLAEDGEILVRGANIMPGYRNLPDKTAETMRGDWLATGDIGEIDAEGYVKIVDRKKELIINAAGKNMSPSNIESTLKAASPLIGQACAIGDRRPYNTALLVLDPDFAPTWAAQHGLGKTPFDMLAAEPKVVAAVQEAVDRANAKLARVEQIKKFTIVAGDWLPGGDELTPTMKLKRKPIAGKYREAIEAMYGES